MLRPVLCTRSYVLALCSLLGTLEGQCSWTDTNVLRHPLVIVIECLHGAQVRHILDHAEHCSNARSY